MIFREAGTHYIIAPGAEAALKKIETLYGNAIFTKTLPMRSDGSQAGYTYARVGPLDLTQFQPHTATWQSGIALAGTRHAITSTLMNFQTLMKVNAVPAANANLANCARQMRLNAVCAWPAWTQNGRKFSTWPGNRVFRTPPRASWCAKLTWSNREIGRAHV